MINHTSVSDLFQRPNLVDYLIVAEHDSLDLGFKLYLGRLDVGLVGLEAGRVVYAELPGATGDLALSLLSRLPGARVVPEAWVSRPPTVSTPWRELINGVREAELGSRWFREIREELSELTAHIAATANVLVFPTPKSSAEAERALNIATELLDWAGIEACLLGEHERALALVDQRERLNPGEFICAVNLERLRLRLLEDGLAADAVGAAQ